MTEPRIAADAVARLTKDQRKAAESLSDQEVRYLVDAYYLAQDMRIRSASQVRAMTEPKEGEPEPVLLLDWCVSNFNVFENQIKGALNRYSKKHPVGAWARSVVGVGPVIASGLLSHISIERCPTAGHIWSFAGLQPTVKWNKGERRPWNAELKTLCAFKLGESFVKVQNVPNDVYGGVFATRKEGEWERNLSGGLADEAARALSEKAFKEGTLSKKFYDGKYSPTLIKSAYLDTAMQIPLTLKPTSIGDECPMLPPAHIHARARRYAVKLFLGHLHTVWFRWYFGVEPPRPYALAILEHAHQLNIPGEHPEPRDDPADLPWDADRMRGDWSADGKGPRKLNRSEGPFRGRTDNDYRDDE